LQELETEKGLSVLKSCGLFVDSFDPAGVLAGEVLLNPRDLRLTLEWNNEIPKDLEGGYLYTMIEDIVRGDIDSSGLIKINLKGNVEDLL